MNMLGHELLELIEVGVLEEDDIERVMSAKFNPNRCGFERKGDIWIRRGRKPDGVCLVVGTGTRGFENNSISDVIFSSSTVKKVGDSKAQYFWEAFPAGSDPLDRTTYMFTYVEPQPGSPKLEELLAEYWNLMPEYQA
ncbi:lycopene beta/epsilon cyclase, partial [Trifolium medium]|nr:lycopene beta/epsilon cyclase [Trifolium medium]